MKKFRCILLSLLVVVALTFSCKHTVTYTEGEIDIAACVENNRQMNISEISSHIDYIQLETSEESLIGQIRQVKIKNGNIFILDKTQAILMFDISGKFIRKIGSIGQGPGEYITIFDFLVSDSSIYTMDRIQLKIIKYDLNGKVLIEKKMTSQPDKFAVLNDSLIAAQYNYPEFAYNNDYRISIFNKNLDKIADLLTSDYKIEQSQASSMATHMRSFFQNVNDTLTFWECRDDIIYKIVNEKTIIEKYDLKYKNKLSAQDGYMISGKNEISKMMESANYFFFSGNYNDKFGQVIYLKNEKTGFNIGAGFTNEKGPSMFGDNVTEDNKLLTVFHAYNFKKQLEKDKIPVEQMVENLQEIMKTCDFDDNPCIMVATLK
ncbi:MAG: 6-bladed beta-propeller [Prevotellaceae bacterium]|jgi:hypothetical protein|nr:6-bladed beta-propeller [Prevotellaceae bacterium]